MGLIEGFIAGTVTGFILKILGNKIADYVKTIASKWRGNLKFSIDKYITDPEWKDLVLRAIFKAQKDLKGKSGQARLEYAKKFIINKTPDMIDPLAERLVQIVYEELTRPLE